MKVRKFVRKHIPEFSIDIYRRKRNSEIKKLWRKRNKHNDTYLKWPTNIDAITVGRYTYGDLNVYANDYTKNKLIIGDFWETHKELMEKKITTRNVSKIVSFINKN